MGDLFIRGTELADSIVLSKRNNGDILVRINNQFFGPYTVTGVLDIEGQGGNDYIAISSRITNVADVRGNAGNDYIADRVRGRHDPRR